MDPGQGTSSVDLKNLKSEPNQKLRKDIEKNLETFEDFHSSGSVVKDAVRRLFVQSSSDRDEASDQLDGIWSRYEDESARLAEARQFMSYPSNAPPLFRTTVECRFSVHIGGDLCITKSALQVNDLFSSLEFKDSEHPDPTYPHTASAMPVNYGPANASPASSHSSAAFHSGVNIPSPAANDQYVAGQNYGQPPPGSQFHRFSCLHNSVTDRQRVLDPTQATPPDITVPDPVRLTTRFHRVVFQIAQVSISRIPISAACSAP
ncbi:hypothetical protein C8R43DRAFT_948030 [Mycena crocata]|nr:hypothetical protein C8R43DRAFT_948030 [Mycena crocata]